jgi:hypothetical protein
MNIIMRKKTVNLLRVVILELFFLKWINKIHYPGENEVNDRSSDWKSLPLTHFFFSKFRMSAGDSTGLCDCWNDISSCVLVTHSVGGLLFHHLEFGRTLGGEELDTLSLSMLWTIDAAWQSHQIRKKTMVMTIVLITAFISGVVLWPLVGIGVK